LGLDPAWLLYQEGKAMFSVELSVGDFGGHAVVALHGDLDLADVPAVESHLIAVVAACGPSVIVDMAGLDFIDCRGLGVLVRVLKWIRASHGDMYLAAPRQHVRRILRLTGLIGIFPVYPSVAHAASGAKPARAVPAAAPCRLRRRAGPYRCPFWRAPVAGTRPAHQVACRRPGWA
jgi:anti-sigma B factor antagonist